MLVKYVFPVACLLSACVMNLFAAGAPLVVFDGEKHAGGSSWSDPKDITKFVLIDAAQTGGAKILRFEGGWKNYWAGGGWNWTNWQGPGSDITSFDFLTITIRKAEGEQLKDVWVQLADAANKTSPQVKLVGAEIVKELPAEFMTVSVPLKLLTGGADFKTVCSLNIGLVPGSADGRGAVEISRIQFDGKD
ncbi:hypothetical protein KH017_10760 [bacterium]|nr:hypothetical protein [bacterium]